MSKFCARAAAEEEEEKEEDEGEQGRGARGGDTRWKDGQGVSQAVARSTMRDERPPGK